MLDALAQAVEVVDRGEHRDVAVRRPHLAELLGRPGEQQLVEGRRGAPCAARSRCSSVSSPDGGSHGRPSIALGAERLGPAARRVAELAVQEADDGGGDVELLRVVGELGRVGADGHQVQREVADDLGRRGHLDDVAEDAVGGGVHVLDLLELLAETERDRLLAQVGELAAGDLVGVDAAGRRGQPRLERRVDAADGLPVGLQRADRLQRQPGLARRVVGRRDQRRQRRLRGGAGHRGGGGVDGVDAGVDRGQQRGELAARGVVGVQVHRQVELRAQRGHQRPGGGRAQQAGHVLDRQHVRPGRDDPLGQAEVVVERVELSRAGRRGRRCSRARPRRRSCRSTSTASIAGRICSTSLSASKIRNTSMPVAAASSTKASVTVGRVRRVADGVAPAQQHLQADVRRRLAELGEPLPRVLGQEPQRHVVRRPAPGLERPQLRGGPGDVAGDGEQVAGAHAGGEQRLVGVAERRVGDGDACPASRSALRERLRARGPAAPAGCRRAPAPTGRRRAAC